MSLASATRTKVGLVLRYPTDLAAVTGIAIGAYLLVTAFPDGGALRLLATGALLLFLPGYALVSVLFPARARVTTERGRNGPGRPGGIDTIERLGLAVGLSLAVVPLLVIPLAMTEWHLTTGSIAATLGAFTVFFAQLAALRRFLLSPRDRYAPTIGRPLERLEGDGTIATASSVLLALGIVTAAVALAFALVAPGSAGSFTELAIYTEDDGELVADNFPTEIGTDESVPVVVTIENQERQEMNYTVVVQEQRLEEERVVDRTELERFDARMDHDEHVESTRTVAPATEDEPVRIAFLLYERGEVPTEPTRENARENVYFWVTATDEPDVESFDSAGGEEEPVEESGEEEPAEEPDEDPAADESEPSIFDELFEDDE